MSDWEVSGLARLFLSYARDDAPQAGAVAAVLERAGHSVWWDRHIRGGAQFSKEIEQALDAADVVIVLWSRRSAESAWVRDEAAAGRDNGRLVPATLDGSPAPLGFRQYQTVNLTGGAVQPGSEQATLLLDAVCRITDPDAPAGRPSTAGTPSRFSRRAVATGAAAAAALAGGAFYLFRPGQTQAPPEVKPLLDQAWQSWTQGDAEGNNQAIGLYRRVTEMAPDYADGWGLLAAAYADRAHWWVSASERPAERERAREAGRRALQLDPKNAHARAAISYARPLRGNWLIMEREWRAALADRPGNVFIIYCLGLLLSHTGRMAESAAFFGQLQSESPTVNQFFFHGSALWGAGRLGEAERLVDKAGEIYSTHPRIWSLHYYMALTGGQAATALAMAENRQARPSRVADEWLDRRAAVARAVITKSDQLTELTAALLRDAQRSVGDASRAVQDLAVLGRLDEAFAVADAFFFSRGFAVPDSAVVAGQQPETTMESRFTTFLFVPTVRLMRADPRFERLVEELGLARYWRAAGVQPDYRKG